MNKILKVIIIFIISFIIAFLFVGYVKNGILVGIKWGEDVTIWDKLKEYYIRTALSNLLPTFVIAVIPTTIVGLPKRSRYSFR